MLSGKTLLITAGPTWEAIDPVRGLTNKSSGKMGYALAKKAFELGMDVKLVSGPVCLPPPIGVETIQVISAQDMYDAVHRQLQAQPIELFIGVAAVADYRPVDTKTQKIKKSENELTLKLTRNPDIVASVARLEYQRPYTVAFAAETENLESNAYSKLVNKHLDMVIANDVSKLGTGFGVDQNQALVITPQQTVDTGRLDKIELAKIILQIIEKNMTP